MTKSQQSQFDGQKEILLQIQKEIKNKNVLLYLYTPFIYDIISSKSYIEIESFKREKSEELLKRFTDHFVTNSNGGISENELLLLIHIILVSNFRLLNEVNICNEQIILNISRLLLSAFNNTSYLWVLIEFLNDITDSLYALYNFDIVLQIKEKEKEKECEGIHLLCLSRWFTIIYHIYHDLKQSKHNKHVLNIEYWNTLSFDIKYCFENTKYNINNDEFDKAEQIGFKMPLNDRKSINYLRCNLIEILSNIYCKIYDNLSGNILTKIERIICVHLTEHIVHCDIFSIKSNKIKSKYILPSSYFKYLEYNESDDYESDDDEDGSYSDDDDDGDIIYDLEINSKIIQKTLNLINIILKYDNIHNEINVCNLLIYVINLLNKSIFLRSQSFDDELSILFENICSHLEPTYFRQINGIECGKGFIPKLLSLIPILLQNTSSSYLKCSISLFISSLLYIFPTQTLSFIKLLPLFINKGNNHIISCSIYQILMSLSPKQRNYLLSNDIIKYETFDEYKDEYNDVCCDVFILEGLWPFLHRIASKANRNLKELSDDNTHNTLQLQTYIDETVYYMDLSLRVFCSVSIHTLSDIKQTLIHNLVTMMDWFCNAYKYNKHNINHKWLINNINLLLQCIAFCLEHNYIKTKQLLLCNNNALIQLIGNLLKTETEKAYYIEQNELMFCDILILISHLNIYNHRSLILYPLISSILIPKSSKSSYLLKMRTLKIIPLIISRYRDPNNVETKNEVINTIIQYIRKLVALETDKTSSNESNESNESCQLFIECVKCVSNLICIAATDEDYNNFYPSKSILNNNLNCELLQSISWNQKEFEFYIVLLFITSSHISLIVCGDSDNDTDKYLLRFVCPSCDFIMNRHQILYKKKQRDNLLKFITSECLKNKNNIKNIESIIECGEIEDTFIRRIPIINKEHIDAKYLRVKHDIYDVIWNKLDKSAIKVFVQITINIIKLLNHSPNKRLKRDKEKHKLWIAKLLFHSEKRIRETVTQYIYILFYYFFGVSEDDTLDSFCAIFCASDDIIKPLLNPEKHYLKGNESEDDIIQIRKNCRHKIIENCIANLYDLIAKNRCNQYNNIGNCYWTEIDDINLRCSISCILEPSSQIQFKMISRILALITKKPLKTYSQLLRISNHSSYLSTSNISLLLQSFSNKNRLFQQYLYRTLIKSEKQINIISNDILRVDGKIYFNEILTNIFPKLVFEKNINVIKAISKYLNRSTSDISISLLHKILPKVLIDISSLSNNNNNEFEWIESHLFNNKRKFLSLLKERPSSLVNELIFICGSGLDSDHDTKQRNNTRSNAEKALSYLSCAIGEYSQKMKKRNKNRNRNKKKKRKKRSIDDNDDDNDDENNEMRSCLLAQYTSGILLGFGQKLHIVQSAIKYGDEEIIASNKRKTLRSLRAIIKLLDNKLPQFASKIITLLKMAMNDEKLRDQTLSVWKDFFNYLSGKHVAQHFAQIVVTLLNFLEIPSPKEFVPSQLLMDIDDDNQNNDNTNYFALTQNPITSILQHEMDIDTDNDVDDHHIMDQGFLTQAPIINNNNKFNNMNNNNNKSEKTNNAQIISLLKEIIINKKPFTEKHYHEIPILPNVLSLRAIKNVIQNTLGNQSLDSKLIHITSLLRNESNGIKKMALNTLLYTIQKQQKEMELVILSNMRYEPLLHNLINSLLPLSTLKDSEILILCANCLGELGAIDFKVLHNQQTHSALSLSLDKEHQHDDDDDDNDDDDDDEDSDLEIIDPKKNHKKRKHNKQKMEEMIKHGESTSDIPLYIDNINDLSLNIIKNYLIPIHRSTNNSTTQNQAQYALQELLKVLQCDLKTPNECINYNKSLNIDKPLSVQNWEQFTEDLQELLIPCLRSTFLIKSERKINNDYIYINNKNKNNETLTVFSTLMYQYGRITLDQWLFKFCKSLLIKIEQMYLEIETEHKKMYPKLKQKRVSPRNHNGAKKKKQIKNGELLIENNKKKLKTFRACLCVKNHSLLTTYLLPFLVYELLEKTQYIYIVIDEIKDVIQYENISLSQQTQLCVHRIFYLVDVLMSWYYAEQIKLKQFYHLLPFFALSNAAYLCKSYNRSIKYFEIFVSSNKIPLLHENKNDNDGRTLPLSLISTGQINKKHIEFWQKIQSEIKEIDAMIGISIFRMDTDIAQQALDFESNGKWNRALNCYEQILQSHPNSSNIEYHKKYLKCLLYLGHFSAVISHVNGVYNTNLNVNSVNVVNALPTLTNMPSQALSTAIIPPIDAMDLVHDFYVYEAMDNNNTESVNETFINELAQFGIESSWRLSRWQLLDEFIQKCSKNQLETNFECKLGQALSLLHSNPHLRDIDLRQEFINTMDNARLIVMKQISSCYIEGYHAVYPYLIKLHMLQELTHYQKTYLCDGDINKLNISMFPDPIAIDDDNNDILQTSEQQQEQYMNVNNSFFWNERLDRTANILSVRESILSLRRILYAQKNLKQEEAYCWLQLAKEARSHKQYLHANTALLYAEKIGENLTVPYIKWQTFLEKIQLTYNQGEIHKSLLKTQKILSVNNKIPSQILSQMNVLIAQWMNETNSYESRVIISKYKSAITQQPKCEEPYFRFATYLDALYSINMKCARNATLNAKLQNDQLKKARRIANVDRLEFDIVPITIAVKYNIPNLLSSMLEKYCLSLSYGHRHVFRSLPRLIDLWFQNGKVLIKLSKLKSSFKYINNNVNRLEEKIMSSIDGKIVWPSYFEEWSYDLPEYQFMCILPIITSRILSEYTHIKDFIKTVLTQCIQKYPPQLLWHIALLINYRHLDDKTCTKRNKTAKKVTNYLKHHIRDKKRLISLVEEMTSVLSSLIQFTPNTSNTKRKYNEQIKCPKYLCNTRRTQPFEVIVPTQMNLEPSLPMETVVNSNYLCYSNDPIRIFRFCEKFVTMSSQAQPKKISLIGTDGLQYSFLIKRESRGDMRKDSRLMEICGVINRLFNGNIESRNRNLNLHNYSVICLTEQIGMIEWVENVDTLRNLLNNTYKFQTKESHCTLKDITSDLRSSLANLQRKFVELKVINSAQLSAEFEKRILSSAPVIFHIYFERNWINCNEWYNARLLYTRSAAAWSMVGFIVALGDRHLENILINVKTGECIHVDFDCLFDKAKGFKVPEQVSFRLTNNIIDGFGVIGVEGVFRKSAECVLNVLKNNKETLLQSLRSFIHDPLIEQQSNSLRDDKSMRNQLKNINDRLNGYVPSMNFNHDDPKLYPKIDTRNNANTLSTNGCVQQLIEQCSNKQLLSKMFVGWMPFI